MPDDKEAQDPEELSSEDLEAVTGGSGGGLIVGSAAFGEAMVGEIV